MPLSIFRAIRHVDREVDALGPAHEAERDAGATALLGEQAMEIVQAANRSLVGSRCSGHDPNAREMGGLFILVRALTYATLFIGIILIFLPARLLSSAGIVQPPAIGVWQIAGIVVGTCGAVLAVACVLTFTFVGKGTPAPFDPPRRLVVRGPYRLVRNPMYIGAGLALAGAALFYQSVALLGYGGAFLLATHLFVVLYEEPTLRRTFGREYEAYCERVGRWWPRSER